MVEENLHFLDDNFRVKILEIDEDSQAKAGAVTYDIGEYLIREVGNLSTMIGGSIFGFMKKQWLVLTPYQVDAPMLIYERTVSKGLDTMTVQFVDTMLNPENEGYIKRFKEIEQLKEMYATSYEYSSGGHWYDKHLLSISIEKQGKKNCKDVLDKLYRQIFEIYIEMLKEAEPCDKDAKLEKVKKFSQRLSDNGAPIIEGFIKENGEDAAKAFFDRIVFGADKWA